MSKSQEDKLERDDVPMIVGPVKLSNGFEETTEKTSGGEKTETSTNTKSVTAPQDTNSSADAPQDANSSADAQQDVNTKSVTDVVVQDAPQDANSSADAPQDANTKSVTDVVVQDATSGGESVGEKTETSTNTKSVTDVVVQDATSGDESVGEKTETSTNTKSVTDVVVQDAPQEPPQDATSSANGRKGKEAINDLNIAPQDVASSADEKKGKEKVVEQVVQVTLQDRIASAATRKINTPIWFRLVASNQENTNAPLPQISTASLRIKNSNMELSFIKKYLVKKLDLKSENEVELYLENEPLDSSIMLSDLWQYWISTKKDVGVVKVKVGSSGADYIMVINYGRKSEHVV